MRGVARVVLAAIALGVIATNAFSAQLLINGGFEEGLSGWTSSVNTTTTDMYGFFDVIVTPYEGNSMAYLGVDGTEASLDASLGQTFSTVGYESPATLSSRTTWRRTTTLRPIPEPTLSRY